MKITISIHLYSTRKIFAAWTFQINFVLHLDEAIHILNNPLPLPVWMKQLPSYAIGSETQIVLIFKNTVKAASLLYNYDSKISWIIT